MADDFSQFSEAELQSVIQYFDGVLTVAEEAAIEHRAAADDNFSMFARTIGETIHDLKGIHLSAGLDVAAVSGLARRERALFWRWRFDRAIKEMAERGLAIAGSLRDGAAAALEVTTGLSVEAANLFEEPARACLRANAGMQFQYAQTMDRGVRDRAHESTAQAGGPISAIILASSLSGARVEVDEAEHQVRVVFLGEPYPCQLLLLPAAPDALPLLAEVQEVGGLPQAVFHDVAAGAFLLALPGGE